MDYGHDLKFGTFITPSADNAQATVQKAVDSERAGLDLVTFQDHPYQRRFLDTWTLLSYVGARTERISLAPNVANLPLRQPAVLARSAASLDDLTDGRVELGLGAGAFWDAIAAMGGRRLSPPEAVQALREGIDVIRAIWGERNTFVDGDFHHLAGAKSFPPPHDIGIWIGAYKPRMLTLTGEYANGWLPSLNQATRMGLTNFRHANEQIDEAALNSGRTPSDVRRLLNVGAVGDRTAREWVDMLASLAIDDGFSTFIFSEDDSSRYLELASEIAPQVRDEVHQARRRQLARDVPPEPAGS